MESQNKEGKIQIFAKNIISKANGQILEESKKTKNNAEQKNIQNGKANGVNNGKHQLRKEFIELRVLKIEGPFDENNNKVNIIGKKGNGILIK